MALPFPKHDIANGGIVILTETIVTFVFYFVAGGAVIYSRLHPTTGNQLIADMAIAVAFAVPIIVLACASGYASGCHINSSISIGLWANRRLSSWYLPCYLIGQFGYVLACWVLERMYGDRAVTVAHLGAPEATAGMSNGSIVLAEALGTGIIVLVVAATAGNTREDYTNADKANAPYAIGLAVGMMVFALSSFTGGGVNPGRTIIPMIMSGYSDNWLAYLIGQLLGGIIGAFLAFQVIARGTNPA